VLAAVLAVNTARLPRNQVAPSAQASAVAKPPAVEYLASLLSGAIQIRTVSYDKDNPDGVSTDRKTFTEFHGYLREHFPLVHAPGGLQLTTVNEHSLLYEWRGSTPSLEPCMLMAHLDVVPTPDLHLWSHEPFSGDLAPDGEGRPCIWGRGAIDNKHNVLMQLQAVESLLAAGFRPRRTLFLAYGHDEEIGGEEGAKHIAEHLAERNVRLAFILDEGPFIVKGAFPGMRDRHVACVGHCEKGFVNVRLTVDAVPSCHSSQPPAETSVGILANAIARLERRPFNGSAQGFAETLRYMASELPLAVRVFAANSWLFKPVLKFVALRKQQLAPLFRTTTAVTIVRAGVKMNLVPQIATAWVNHRVHPSQSTLKDVIDYDRKVIGDERVKLEAQDASGGEGWLPSSPVSSLCSEGFEAIKQTVADCFQVPTAPLLMMGNTDTRHYWGVAKDIYRFTPVMMDLEEVKMFHGVNERITTDNLSKLFAFYVSLIERVDKLGQTHSRL